MNRKIKEKKKQKLRYKRMIKEFPFLNPERDCKGNPIKFSKKRHKFFYTEWDNLLYGWKLLFGEGLLKEIKQVLIKDDILNQIYIKQLKEKFGELRIYTNYGSEELYKVIDKYTTISSNVCYKCGKPDVPMVNTGWICPECRECFEKKNRFQISKLTYDEMASTENRIPDFYTIRTYNADNGYTSKKYTIRSTADKLRKRWAKIKTRQERRINE